MIFHLVSLLIFAIAINAHEDFQPQPHIRQIPWLPNSQQQHPPQSSHDDDNNADNEIPVLNNFLQKFSSTVPPPTTNPPPIKLPFVNRPLQVTLLAVIMSAAIFANGSVIANISRDSLKLRMVHFLLIRHVCIADCLGAILVLPVPLVAIVQGEWVFSENVCAAVSTTTASLWTMHLLAVALYRADRVLAVWLPTGRYPSFSVKTTNICLVLIWVGAIVGSYGATFTFGHTFQPALALCLPNVPPVFFIIVFAGYCIGLVGLTTGYVLAFARRRRRKRKRERESKLYAELCSNTPFEPTPNDFISCEDIESCDTSERGRHRRALSDEYSASKQAQMFTPNSKTHRRVWSESAAAYCPTNLTSIVTRSTQMSYDSSSFPQNSSDTNINDYDRLTEDDGSSDFSVRKLTLTHSVSFDGSMTSHQSQSQIPSRKNFLFAQSKSFDCHQSRSFDPVDISSKQQGNNMSSHFNSMTMYESVMRSSTNNSKINSNTTEGREMSPVTSNSHYSSSSFNIKSGLQGGGGNQSTGVTTCSDLDDCLGLSKQKQSTTDTQLYSNNDEGSGDNPTPIVDTYPDNKMVPLSLYSWPLDNTLSGAPSTKRSTIGVIMETQSSDSLGVLHQRIPLQDTHHYVSSRIVKPQDFNFTVDPNAILSVGSSRGGVIESILDKPEGNNNTKTVNFKGGHSRPEGNNNNVLQVRMVRKQRPRTRVKHFRPKPTKTGPAKRALASYAVSVGHLLLYLPAMFVVGLKGQSLPPGAALFCGLVVYCEFLVQPIALLLVSPRLRNEVSKTIYCLCGRR